MWWGYHHLHKRLMSTIASAPAATDTILEVLPNELLCQIFEHLTVMWRIVCRSVCQRWRHLLLATKMIPTTRFRFAHEAAGGGIWRC